MALTGRRDSQKRQMLGTGSCSDAGASSGLGPAVRAVEANDKQTETVRQKQVDNKVLFSCKIQNFKSITLKKIFHAWSIKSRRNKK